MRNIRPRYYAYILLMFIAVMILTACGSKKNLTKSKTSEYKVKELHTELSNVAVSSSTTTDKAQGEIDVPPVTACDSGEVKDGKVILDNPVFSSTTTVDPKTGSVKQKTTIKDKKVNFDIDRITVTEKTETTQTKSDLKETVKTSSVASIKEVEKPGAFKQFNPNYFYWLLLLLGIPIWKYRKELFG